MIDNWRAKEKYRDDRNQRRENHAGDPGAYAEELRLANLFACVDMNVPIGGSPLVCFCKKIIRKLTRFCIRPLVERQNEFNAHSVRTLNEMNVIMENMKKDKQKQDELIEKLSSKIRELEKQ